MTFQTTALCSYEHGSQLAEAVAFLTEHRGQVAFVTIDLGANDILSGGGVPAVLANLPVILGTLKAADPTVPIIGMSYYDPLLASVWFSTQSVDAVEDEAELAAALNGFLGGLYGLFGIPVADVFGAFSTLDSTPVGSPPTPRNVLIICQLTWMCAGAPHGPDIHANNEGYGVIAQAFLPHVQS